MLKKDDKAPLTVKCPSCGREVVWSSDNPDRPFCSSRCRTLDLAAWAEERYRIEGKADDEEDLPAKPAS